MNYMEDVRVAYRADLREATFLSGDGTEALEEVFFVKIHEILFQ
jgi:hypothetical protein